MLVLVVATQTMTDLGLFSLDKSGIAGRFCCPDTIVVRVEGLLSRKNFLIRKNDGTMSSGGKPSKKVATSFEPYILCLP